MDVAATPYLIKDPRGGRGQARPAARQARGRAAARSSPAATPASSTSRATSPPARRAAASQKLKIEGLEFIPEYRRTYPRDWMASQLLGSVGTDGDGLGGLEYSLDKHAAAAPTASAGSSRTRSARRSRCATSSRPSPARPCG